MMGLFYLESGEERWFLGPLFVKNRQKNAKKSSQWEKLSKKNK
jgi:hypothetical protein